MMSEQFGIKPPYFENEGALHMTRGKFILSMSGVKNNKKISERTRNIVIIAVIVTVVALLAGATLLAGHQPNSLPYQYKLCDSIGQPIETVVQNMEVTMDAVEQLSPGVYSVKDGCKLSGVPLALKLYFGEDALLNGFEYLAEYEAGTNKAASDLYKIILDLRLDVIQPEGLDGIKLTKGGLKKYLQNNALSVQSSSNHNSYVDESVDAYMHQLEAQESWEGRVGEYLVRKAVLYEDVDIQYSQETEKVYVRIGYIIEPDRSMV